MAILGVLVALLAAGVLYQRIGGRRDAGRFAAPGALIDVGGHRLHVTSSGDGSPAVLLDSGLAASSLSWAVVQPEIAKFTRVWAYDRAGFAWSDVPSCPRTFDRIVDEFSAVLTHVASREPCILVGHSFGSFIVRAYARRHPEAVAALVLVDPPTVWLTLTSERARLLRRGRRLSRVGALLAHVGIVRASLALLTGGAPGGPRRIVKVLGPTAARTLERLVGEVRKLPPEVYPVLQSFWSQPKCFDAMAGHLLTLERDGAAIVNAVSSCEVPVVVISSGDQPPEQLDAHRMLAEASAGGRHVIAARSAHWVQFDEPELVVAVIKGIVDAHR
ncbi:MAG TPA: alpha/beta hydrolase [Vicinamibacterales bacterium]|nr:alpha/beta hydrolase [Vicinamibacterales bacterium]